MHLIPRPVGRHLDTGDDKGAGDGLVGALGKVNSSGLDTTYDRRQSHSAAVYLLARQYRTRPVAGVRHLRMSDVGESVRLMGLRN